MIFDLGSICESNGTVYVVAEVPSCSWHEQFLKTVIVCHHVFDTLFRPWFSLPFAIVNPSEPSCQKCAVMRSPIFGFAVVYLLSLVVSSDEGCRETKLTIPHHILLLQKLAFIR